MPLLAFLFAFLLAGQSPDNWTQQSPRTSPPARWAGSLAYGSGRVVLFGGYGGPLGVLGDTWAWDGSNWSPQIPQNPPARISAGMAYDSANSQVVLFGGASSPGSNVMPASVFNDTWEWNGFSWIQKSPQTSPPGRSNQAMAYDSTNQQVVLFGGVSASGGALGDTWLWNGSNWTQQFPQTNPPARKLHAAAYDSALGHLVLFGGEDATAKLFNDTWLWSGSTWIQESPQTSPSARFEGPALAYDSSHSQLVLFGGEANGSIINETWTYGSTAVLPSRPSISGVVSASAFGAFSSVAQGGWIEIYGSNLASDIQGWTGADFNRNFAPTTLGGVSVSVDDQAAFVDYISPTQVDVQLPFNIAFLGTHPVTITNGSAVSAPFNVTVNAAEPGLLAPASFKLGGNQYVVAQFLDGTYVLPVGAIAGVTSRPAKPGETIIIYGVGFGDVTPGLPAGQIERGPNHLFASCEFQFGQSPPVVPGYYGLAPDLVGVYQFNIEVPAVADSDLVPFTFHLGGVPGVQTLFTAVHQ
jgi:uncharacterized protein (TIGR03437 family)